MAIKLIQETAVGFGLVALGVSASRDLLNKNVIASAVKVGAQFLLSFQVIGGQQPLARRVGIVVCFTTATALSSAAILKVFKRAFCEATALFIASGGVAVSAAYIFVPQQFRKGSLEFMLLTTTVGTVHSAAEFAYIRFKLSQRERIAESALPTTISRENNGCLKRAVNRARTACENVVAALGERFFGTKAKAALSLQEKQRV